MKTHLALPVIYLAAQALCAQAPFTEKKYGWSVEKNMVYGAAVDYTGQTDTLTLDLYKPLNSDTARPLLILAHGGSWLSGCKENMAWLCQEMAERGYVAATVNYRKGWHKDDYVPTPINPGIFEGGNCLYPADSMEILRAIYRGMQDLKGAIRWLKARVYADSSCNHAVLVGGESAGAFLALAAGLLDQPGEKPPACGDLPDAPPPGSNLSNCAAKNCFLQTLNLPPGALARPDLGPVEGTLNQNGFNAHVDGIISFYGGVPESAGIQNWIQGADTPAIYLYHQTCDGVVPFLYSQPYAIISGYCNLGFTPWHYNTPHIYGNGAIAGYLAALPHPPLFSTDFLPCDAFNPGLAVFECPRYFNNGSYHYTHNPPERAANIAAFFSPVITAKLGSPPCLVPVASPGWTTGLTLAPNPFGLQPVLYCDTPPDGPMHLTWSDAQGRVRGQERRLFSAGANPLQWDATLPAGIYYLRLAGKQGAAVWKMVYKPE